MFMCNDSVMCVCTRFKKRNFFSIKKSGFRHINFENFEDFDRFEVVNRFLVGNPDLTQGLVHTGGLECRHSHTSLPSSHRRSTTVLHRRVR